MKVFHCPNKNCRKIVFRSKNNCLPYNLNIEIKCFHCGSFIAIITENKHKHKKE